MKFLNIFPEIMNVHDLLWTLISAAPVNGGASSLKPRKQERKYIKTTDSSLNQPKTTTNGGHKKNISTPAMNKPPSNTNISKVTKQNTDYQKKD
jgi:hypothetical protein